MWEEIYVWIESYAGCSYDVDKELELIADVNEPFINTYEWRLVNEQLIDQLSEIYDVVSANAENIPDNMPNDSKIKKMFTEKILFGMLNGLNGVKKQLHIQQVDINDYNVLLHHIDVITDLINMLKENSINDIIEKRIFDKYNEENEDAFTDLFGLTSSDLSNMSYTINGIIEEFGSDEEDEMDEDELE